LAVRSEQRATSHEPLVKQRSTRSPQLAGRSMEELRMKGLHVWGAPLLSIAVLLVFLAIWHAATRQEAVAQVVDAEYARLVGAAAATGQKSAFPTPGDVGRKLWEHVTDPFYDKGPNDKGIGVQLAYSIARVLAGFLLAAAVAIPVGFLIGMSPLVYRAFDPFIQGLKPISPLA